MSTVIPQWKHAQKGDSRETGHLPERAHEGIGFVRASMGSQNKLFDNCCGVHSCRWLSHACLKSQSSPHPTKNARAQLTIQAIQYTYGFSAIYDT
jgi:hypothetical protein